MAKPTTAPASFQIAWRNDARKQASYRGTSKTSLARAPMTSVITTKLPLRDLATITVAGCGQIRSACACRPTAAVARATGG